MKRFALSLVMFLSVFIATFAQDGHGYNLYGQLFGSSTGIGVGFDSRFKTGGILGYAGGIGFTNLTWNQDPIQANGFVDTETNSKGVSIPLEVNAIMGKRASKFEIGLGLTAYLVDRTRTRTTLEFVEDINSVYSDWIIHTESKKHFRPSIIGTMNIGYRLQRKSGFFMKLGFTVLVGDLKCSPIDGVVALPNLCFGYTLPSL